MLKIAPKKAFNNQFPSKKAHKNLIGTQRNDVKIPNLQPSVQVLWVSTRLQCKLNRIC